MGSNRWLIIILPGHKDSFGAESDPGSSLTEAWWRKLGRGALERGKEKGNSKKRCSSPPPGRKEEKGEQKISFQRFIRRPATAKTMQVNPATGSSKKESVTLGDSSTIRVRAGSWQMGTPEKLRGRGKVKKVKEKRVGNPGLHGSQTPPAPDTLAGKNRIIGCLGGFLKKG